MRRKADRDSNRGDSGQMANDADNSGGEGARNSLDENLVNEFLKSPQVEQRLKEIAQSASQGVKDRRIAKLENELGDIVSQLNLSPEQQEQYNKLQMNETIKRLNNAVFGQGQQPGNQGGDSPQPPSQGSGADQLDYVTLFNNTGYDPNNVDKETIDFIDSFEGSQVELQNALIRRRAETSPAQQPARQTGRMPINRSTPLDSNQAAKLQNEYSERLKNIRPGDVNAVIALKREYREKGLDIY